MSTQDLVSGFLPWRQGGRCLKETNHIKALPGIKIVEVYLDCPLFTLGVDWGNVTLLSFRMRDFISFWTGRLPFHTYKLPSFVVVYWADFVSPSSLTVLLPCSRKWYSLNCIMRFTYEVHWTVHYNSLRVFF